jgi:flavin-dependent dehydrogenase
MLPLLTYKNGISGERFMLCGDAASLVNPATGSGIGQAMQSGRFAGWQAMKCFEKDDFSAGFISSYDKTVYDKIWHENRNYLLLRDHVFRYPWRMNSVISAGSRNKSIYKTILKMLK